MNWYTNIKIAQEVIESPQDVTYLDIGHSKADEFKLPNIIWAFLKGNLELVEESSDAPGHHEAFGDRLDNYRDYTGRYESDTGRLSINTPYNIMGQTNQVPNILMRRLYQQFPDTKKVYVF